MYYIRIVATLFIITLSLFWQSGCKQDEGPPPSSTSHPLFLEEKNKKATVKVTIGGKVWKIDPNTSYQATGVWTNPNPRSLTELETERLQKIPALIQTLKTQLDELDKELRYLKRLDQPHIKIHYNFGKPPHFSRQGKIKMIDLGEFPMEMDIPTKIPSIQEEEP